MLAQCWMMFIVFKWHRTIAVEASLGTMRLGRRWVNFGPRGKPHRNVARQTLKNIFRKTEERSQHSIKQSLYLWQFKIFQYSFCATKVYHEDYKYYVPNSWVGAVLKGLHWPGWVPSPASVQRLALSPLDIFLIRLKLKICRYVWVFSTFFSFP